MHRENVIIVGSGIIGLTSARALQDAGYDVEIWARDTLHNTCSTVAAAFWYPYVIQPEEVVRTWGVSTLDRFKEMAANPAAGITERKINAIFKQKTPDPVWAADIPSFERLRSDQLPDSHADGFCFDSVTIEMPIFLPYIIEEFQKAGGRLLHREVTSLNEPCREADIVINCIGIGAKELCDDNELTPVRGQVVVTKKEKLEEMYSDCSDMIYIIPFRDTCVLGGSAEPGQCDLTPSDITAQSIMHKCTDVLPQVADWEVIDQRVGLRPSRTSVRLEIEERPDETLLIHNYGHGGAGVTLSYGCADAVLDLVREHESALAVV